MVSRYHLPCLHTENVSPGPPAIESSPHSLIARALANAHPVPRGSGPLCSARPTRTTQVGRCNSSTIRPSSRRALFIQQIRALLRNGPSSQGAPPAFGRAPKERASARFGVTQSHRPHRSRKSSGAAPKRPPALARCTGSKITMRGARVVSRSRVVRGSTITAGNMPIFQTSPWSRCNCTSIPPSPGFIRVAGTPGSWRVSPVHSASSASPICPRSASSSQVQTSRKRPAPPLGSIPAISVIRA